MTEESEEIVIFEATTMAAFVMTPRPLTFITTFRNRPPICSQILGPRQSVPSRARRASANVSMARRQRVDPSDEAFVTCTSCGSDEITSASNIIRKGTAILTCSQCNTTWTARASDALTTTGTLLVNHDAASENENEEETLKVLGVKLFVGGLSPKVNDAALRAALEEFGEVREARVVYDRVTGRSRGFGFATMVGKSAAAAVMDVLSGDSSTSLGRRLKIREATE